MYIVVFRNTKESGSEGVITWTPFESKEKFKELFKGDECNHCEVLEEGVTKERALELVRSPDARIAVQFSLLKEAAKVFEKAPRALQGV